MRKIEEQMLNAISEGKDWTNTNTSVVFSDHTGNPYLNATVYLHGHSIAEVLPTGEIIANKDTLVTYPTNTTKSRLRALSINVYTKKGVLYLNNEKLN